MENDYKALSFEELENYIEEVLSGYRIVRLEDSSKKDNLYIFKHPSIDYKVGMNLVVGLSASIFTGENDSEFGMMYWSDTVNLIFKYYF